MGRTANWPDEHTPTLEVPHPLCLPDVGVLPKQEKPSRLWGLLSYDLTVDDRSAKHNGFQMRCHAWCGMVPRVARWWNMWPHVGD